MNLKVFTQPYIFTHILSFLSYPIIRAYYLDKKELNISVGLGITREGLMILLFIAIITFKFNTFWTPEHFLVLIFWYTKIIISVLVYFGKGYQIIFLYVASWLALWVMLEVPKYSGQSQIIELSGTEFMAIFSEENKSKILKINRFICCVLFSDLSQESILVF